MRGHIPAAKDQARQRICTVSPEPLQITQKEEMEMKTQAKFYRLVQDSLVWIAYANSESLD